MKKYLFYSICFFLALLIGLSGCGLMDPLREPTMDQEDLRTQIAIEVARQQTQQAAEAGQPQPSATASATSTFLPSPTGTLAPSSTASPDTAESTPLPSATSTRRPPTATATPLPCDQAAFIKDVTVKDKSLLQPGEEFTKTWRIKNTGVCQWTRQYALVFVSGDRLEGNKVVWFEKAIQPGKTVDLSVDLIAPKQAGTYIGYWMLRNSDKEFFGIGSQADQAFWVRIRVPKSTPTPTPVPCNQAILVKDIPIQPDSELLPGEAFTKSWRFRNIGSCTWSTEYSLAFVSGAQMAGPDRQFLPAEVLPGQEIELAVQLVAPQSVGDYTGAWKLSDPLGNLFGDSSQKGQTFKVNIQVKRDSSLVYDILENYCAAQWKSSQGDLPCPLVPEIPRGSVNDDGKRIPKRIYQKGAFVLILQPKTETGEQNDTPALAVRPDQAREGYILAEIPALNFQVNDHFLATTGCMHANTRCNTTFQLQYTVQDGEWQVLSSWKETYDGVVHPIEIDLSALTGQPIWLRLVVLNNGNSSSDWAFWMEPRIVRYK